MSYPPAAADASQLPLIQPFEDPGRAGGIVEDLEDGNGPTAMLQAAARVGDMQRARTAIDAGATLGSKDSWGLAPIHSAAILGSIEMVTFLVERRAAVDEISTRGTSALHLAAAEGRDDVLLLLLSLKADVALPTSHGTTPLQIARRRNLANATSDSTARPSTPSDIPPGRAERAISRELSRRLRMADEEEEEKRRQLAAAVASRERLEAQLGAQAAEALRAESLATTPRASTAPGTEAGAEGGVEGAEGAVDGGEPAADVGAAEVLTIEAPEAELAIDPSPEPAPVAAPAEPQGFDPVGNACEYWRTMTGAIAEARKCGEEAMKRSYLREIPEKEDLDPFPWTGEHQALQALAIPDPDDLEFVAGYEWLQEVAMEMQRRADKVSSSQGPAQQADFGEDYIQGMRDKAMNERTGKTQTQWVSFARDLQERNCPWDWSSVDVRHRPHKCEALSKAGVFAVGSPNSVVFKEGEVIGPLSGVLRRRSRYEKLYYSQRQWVLHDPGCYELSLRLQTAELKLETLVLDLRAGPGQNRLRYLAETRPDPLGLRAVLRMEADAGPRSVLPPRNRMPRPRSRPGSPESGPYGRQQDTVAMAITPMSMQAVPDDTGKGANVTWAEVLVDGYPHVFVIATRQIIDGEELTCDHGEEYWASQRAMLTRLLEIGRLGHETVVRVNREDAGQQKEEESTFELPKRERMRRPKEGD